MNDDVIRKRLAELDIPTPDPAVKDRALHRALMAFAHARGTPSIEERLSRTGLWRWTLAGGAALAVAVIALWVAQPSVAPGELLTSWQRTLQEVETLFPGQLNALIERDGAFAVELSDRPVVGIGQPVMIEFARGSHVVRVLSYSGRLICVELGGEKVCLEPLVTADGGVLLSGEDFLWTAEHPATQSGYRIVARYLQPAT